MGVRSSGRPWPAVTSIRLPTCAAWHGRTWLVITWMWAERWWPWAMRRGSGRGRTACWALTSSPGRLISLLLQQQLWAWHVRVERRSKLGHSLRPKVNGGHTTGACWVPRRFPCCEWEGGLTLFRWAKDVNDFKYFRWLLKNFLVWKNWNFFILVLRNQFYFRRAFKNAIFMLFSPS